MDQEKYQEKIKRKIIDDSNNPLIPLFKKEKEKL